MILLLSKVSVDMMKSKIKFIIPFISLLLFIFLAFRVSYSYFVYNKEVVEIDLKSGDINIDFTKENNTSSVSANQMMSDAAGKKSLDYIEFTVTGTADTESILYELEIVPNGGNSIDSKYIKYYLTEVDNNNEIPLTSPLLYTEFYDSMVNSGKGIYQNIVSGNLDGTSKTTIKKYRLRAWVDESYEGESNKNFDYSVYLYAINVDSSKYEKINFNYLKGNSSDLQKYVDKDNKYGSLPAAIRDGYEFRGWFIQGRSNNIAEMSSDGTDNDSWNGFPTMNNGVPGRTYETVISKASTSSLNTPVFSYSIADYNKPGYATVVSREYYFDNDIVVTLTCPDDADPSHTLKSLLYYGEKGFTDYKIVSFTDITTYELSIEVTSNTDVTEETEHTLIAVFEKKEEPTLELSKITYINVPFDDSWTYDSHAHVEDDTLVFREERTEDLNKYDYASSDFIDVNNEFWYMTVDGYQEDNNLGIYWDMIYYDSSKNSTNCLNGASSNGTSISITPNTWYNDNLWNNTIESFKSTERYGPNVKYIKINFQYNNLHSCKNLRVRDVKVYGQMENDFYLINVNAGDAEGIKEMKYAKGNQSIDYFKNNGVDVMDDQIKVFENGIYTVYVKGNRGNSIVKTIEITNIV